MTIGDVATPHSRRKPDGVEAEKGGADRLVTARRRKERAHDVFDRVTGGARDHRRDVGGQRDAHPSVNGRVSLKTLFRAVKR